MASKQETVDKIVENSSQGNDIRTRKMFGEYAIYCYDKVIGLICDEDLFIKITNITDKFLDESHNAPPYPGAKNFRKVPKEKIEDSDWLSDLARQTANLVPKPKPKKKK